MKRAALVFVAVLAVLFGAVSLAKLGSSGGDAAEETESTSAAERRRTLLFWELYREATDHRIAGRTEKAAETYSRALELNEEHEDALYYLGSMELERGGFAAAERAWMRLLEVNPLSGRAHSRLGVLYSCLEPTGVFDLARAEAEFKRAQAINKEQTGPLLGLGEVALIRGDLDAASRYLDRVLGSNSSSVPAHFLEGYVAWRRGDRNAAASSFAEAVRQARPAQPVAGVAGEGDTKAGTKAMLATPTRCRGVRVHLEGLDSLADDELAAEAEAHYARLAASLGQAGR